MVILASAALILAILAIWVSSTLLKHEGLPKGKLIYADPHRWQSTVKPLFDRELMLTGKPDYIIKNGHEIIPIEIKSNRGNSDIPDSHLLQLAAYCYLIHKEYDQKPTYGIIHYTSGNQKTNNSDNHTFAVDYSKELEHNLLTTMMQMRSYENSQVPDRSHQSAWRCKRCGYRSQCDQRL